MTCIQVYKQCAQITYKTTICSKATFFVIFTYLAGILISFVLAYECGGLWLKHTIFYEQPEIKYKYEYIFTAQTNNFNPEVLCSNMLQFQNENKYSSCPSVKVREIDVNMDGKYDKLHFNLKAQLPDNNYVRSIMLVLMLDYKIHTVCPLHFQPAVLMQSTHNGPGQIMQIDGDVTFLQSRPITCHMQTSYANHNKQIEDIRDVITNQIGNNFSVQIANEYIFWTASDNSMFELHLELRYPEQAIRYKPSTLQVVKYAWIHYIAIFLPISWLINKLQSYVFTNRLVTYRRKMKDKID